MKKSYEFTILTAAFLMLAPLSGQADDIELFAGNQEGGTGDAPNVLFVLDNGANFSSNADERCSISADGLVQTGTTVNTNLTALSGTAAGIQQCALYSAIQGIDTSNGARVNIGLMAFNANGLQSYDPVTKTFSNTCRISNSNTGGCLLLPITPLTTENKASILDWIRKWTSSGNTGYNIKGNNSGANGATMQEAWAYFQGKTGVSGRNYSGIKPEASCANNFVVFAGNNYSNNGKPNDGTNAQNSPKRPFEQSNTVDPSSWADPKPTASQLLTIGGTINTYCGVGTLSTDEKDGAYALNWARYMHQEHDIKTYSIGILKPLSLGNPKCNSEYAAHMMKLGEVGGGRFFGTTNFTELKVALENTLSEILAVNSAFASVSLPVSVNTQGTYLNQVYVGMFRPAQGFFPRWHGNLKQYRMGYVDGALQLLDARGAGGLPAISSAGTGFIDTCARSFWTPATIPSSEEYWLNLFDEHCVGQSAKSDAPDGNIVEKGAQGYTLRGARTATSVARNLQTCSTSACTGLSAFAPANASITKVALGNSTMTDDYRIALINWAIGINNMTDDRADNFAAATAVRPSVHGSVVHSRPVAINFGTDAAPQVAVFYGGNDGVLRAINGNRDGGALVGGVAPGYEIWSFMAPEFYPRVQRLRDNDVPITYRGTKVPITLPKEYGFDGALAAHMANSNTAWVYATMRRGGRSIYAFNFTTAGSGLSAPTLKWVKGCPVSGCTGIGVTTDGISQDMSNIGQTWSTPRVLKASAYTATGPGTEKPILIFGGGYDNCEDHDAVVDGVPSNNTCDSNSKGRLIYALDADTGTVLKTLPTDRGVAGEITLVNDAQGLARYAYAADLGGNVYRITIDNLTPANWTITKIASLGCATPATCSANRKFMFAPDVLVDNGLHYLLLGSGDREKPLDNYTATKGVQNYFFMLKDKPADTSWLSSESDNCGGASIICLNSLYGITSELTPSTADLAEKPKGWRLSLGLSEQVVTSAITVFGSVTFSTHIPAGPSEPGVCSSSLGNSSVYNIKYLDASSTNGTLSRYQSIAGGGLPPSPVAGKVTLDSGQTVPFVIGANPISPLQASKPTPPPPALGATQARSRVYWYVQQ